MKGQAYSACESKNAGLRNLTVSGISVVAFAALLWLAWTASETLLLIFSGVLFGVFLDGMTRGLGYGLPFPRAIRLTFVVLSLVVIGAGLTTFGGATVASQARELGMTVREQSDAVRTWLKEHGVDLNVSERRTPGRDSGREHNTGEEDKGQRQGGLAGLAASALKSTGSLLSETGSVLGPAVSVVLGLFNALGNLLVIAFIGIAVAAEPASYHRRALYLIPRRQREKGTRVLDRIGETLRYWLFGQLVTMTVIFLLTWAGLAFLGIGGALILGLQAGLLAFVPTIGPMVAGLIIILSSLATGINAALGAFGVYLAVQTVESYGLTPFIQRRALDIPAATIFAGQLLLGVLFGLWGIALALPLMAVIKVLLEELWIEEGSERPAP